MATSDKSASALWTPPIPIPGEVAAVSQAVRLSSAAALTFLLYDICLTFGDEVDLFWGRKWTFMKINFFFVRYFPLLAQATLLLVGSELTERIHFGSHGCFIWQIYQGVISVLTIMSCDFVLLARIYALYHTRTRTRILVSVCYILEIVVMCMGLGFALPSIRFDEMCVVTGMPSGLLLYAGGAIAFQTLLFGLTLYKFIAGVRSGWGNVPIIVLLMRDGTWAFFMLFMFLVGKASLYGLRNHSYAGVLFAWTLSSYSFCGYRILLNINNYTRRAHHLDTPTISHSIRFNTRHAADTPSCEMTSLPSNPQPVTLSEGDREDPPFLKQDNIAPSM
ncbi:hypothetical protein VNI00_003649 [Paramarasmius palmivorus]|uniref:DUF6533 domain-containing protein n=1 Tax=Paramarasmius palmivorus TaxID=297713 RepID=A0AAW0DTP1_9AGAR